VSRARIILLSASGKTNMQIARQLGLTNATVGKWRRRFLEQDVSGLNFRFRFITADAAFVDAEITLNNVMGLDGKLHTVLPIKVVFTSVRRGEKRFIEDERARSAGTKTAPGLKRASSAANSGA
jgi:hypothetical protein